MIYRPEPHEAHNRVQTSAFPLTSSPRHSATLVSKRSSASSPWYASRIEHIPRSRSHPPIQIPDNIALGRQECLDRCGIKREGQKTTQRQQRNANNALSSGTSSTWPSTKTKVYSPTSTHYTRSNSQQTGNVFGALADDASSAIASTGISKNVLIALCVVVGAMAIGYVAIGIVWLAGRRRHAAEKANRFYVRPEMTGRSLVPTTEDKYDAPQQ